MKVLLTHGYFLEEDEKEQLIMKPYVPLGILYISAYLEQHGVENEVFDSTFSNRKSFCDYITAYRPGVIGIYTNLMTKPNVLNMIGYIRERLPGTRIVLGGPEVRASAERFLRAGADYIVIGEGELTMLELVRAIEQDREAAVVMIPGLAILLDGQFIRTAEREKIADLDQLPFPNRKKVNLQLYLDTWNSHHGRSAVSVNTMRGCPYSCRWCSRAVYGASYRRRSPENVVRELEEVYNTYRPGSIWFVDDVFTINHKWLRGFNDVLQAKQLKISYECITRADRLNEEAIMLLKASGCFRVWIGAESGSQQVIDLMDRRVKVEQVRDMIRLASKHGLETGTFIMLGYPGETEADIKETIYHLKQSNPDHFTITIAYPIRGTELFQQVESQQLNSPDWATSTDRDINFKRTYNRRYYDHAVKHVVCEVNYHKLLQQKLKNWKRIPYLKLQSVLARGGMWLEKNRSAGAQETPR
ncbi:MAG TPA: radical SAM protein [Chitinophagaceae bacterium]